MDVPRGTVDVSPITQDSLVPTTSRGAELPGCESSRVGPSVCGARGGRVSRVLVSSQYNSSCTLCLEGGVSTHLVILVPSTVTPSS